MFKKADKQELRTWLIGDIFITLILAFVSVVCIVGLFTGTFSVGKLIWGIVFTLLTVLFCSFFFKIINAIKTYEERKALKEKEESEKEAKEKEANKEKFEQEMQEMEELRKIEEQKRMETLAEIEAAKAEAEAEGKTYGEGNR